MNKIFFLLIFSFLLGCNRTQDNVTLIKNAIRHQENGQYLDAIKIYETILDNDPDSSTELTCLLMISSLHGKLEEYYDQISWAEKLLKKNPNSSQGYSEIGSAFFGLKKYDLALENDWIATRLDTNDAVLPFSAAILAEDYKKPEVAIKFYEECIKRDSSFATAYYNIAVNLYDLKDFETAKKYCKTFLKLKPDHKNGQQLYQDIINQLK